MRRQLVGLALVFALTQTARAQAILGTYTIAPPGGGAAITLVLKKDAQGKIVGSLSGNGASYAVDAAMQGDDVAGSLSGGGLRSVFEAHREGSRLRMIVADVGADGKPNYATAREMVLNASTAAVAAEPQSSAATSAQSGNPFAAGAAPDKFAGTFSSADVTLSLSKEGAGYAGTIKYRGTDYPATARLTGETLAGTFKVGTQAYDMTVASVGDGKYVNFSTAGTTYMLARAATSAASGGNPLAGGGSAPAATTALAQTAQDQQIVRLLTSTAWCTFSYSGTSVSAASGTTSTSRAVFSPSGDIAESRNSETTSIGSAGSVYAGSGGNVQRGKWKMENGTLMLSVDGVRWVPQQMKIADNGNGYPIITTGGKEYMMCK